MIAYLLLFICLFQNDVPYKPEDEFMVNFEFTFSKRGESNRDDIVRSQLAESPYDRPDNSPLPHIRVNVKVLKKSPEEVKVKVMRENNQVFKKKIEEGMNLIVFSGFTDDIKDQVSGYAHVIYFLDKRGNALSQIIIEFDDEGYYTINGKRKGKI